MIRTWILLFVLPFLLVSATQMPAHSQEAGDPLSTLSCMGGYRCGSQSADESSDNRRAPAFDQPRAEVASMGSCGSTLPQSQSYNAKLEGVRCGSGGDNRPRKPMPIPDDVLEKWSARASNSRGLSGLEDMQKIRHVEEKIEGTIEYPMTEYWSYEETEGGFNSSRCGTEMVPMMCYRTREESYPRRWTTDDGECIMWAKEDEDRPRAYPNTGRSSDGYTGPVVVPRRERRDDSGSYTRPSQPDRPVERRPPPSYRGESSKEIRDRTLNDYRSSIGRGSSGSSSSSSSRSSGSSSSRSSGSSGSSRSSSGRRSSNETKSKTRLVREVGGRCLKRAQVEHVETAWRSVGRIQFPCVLPRAKFCTWPVRRSASRACPRQSVSYQASYAHDPKWIPGFNDPSGNEVRNYSSMIPNKFDLLPGEVEQRRILLNRGGPSSQLRLELDIKSQYNEYDVQPLTLTCAYKNAQQAKFEINTVGRLMSKAPRLLELPKEGSALEFDRGRPSKIKLVDGARRDMLEASEISRAFPDVEGVSTEYFKTNKSEELAPTKQGWWAETRFRIQLFTKDKWGREMTTSVPNTFDSNQAQYFMNNLTIGLEGQGAMDRFYRPSGPLEWALGYFYKQFGMELTPGRTYYVRVQLVNRGLPFYESGCRGGKRVCEGQDATKDSYSEPIDIPFVADPNVDNRSLFKRLKDLQEKTVLF